MGKLGKKAVERIRAMIAEGYSLTETAAELGHTRKTVASYAVDIEPKTVQRNSGKIDLPLSDEIIKVLYNLQGILGASSIADAVDQAYRDELAAIKYKVIIWDNDKYKYCTKDYEAFTVERLIKVLMKHIESREEYTKMFVDGYHEDVKIIAELEKAVKEKVYVIR